MTGKGALPARILLTLALLAALAAAFRILQQRHALEASRKTIRVVLDRQDLETLVFNADPLDRERFYRDLAKRGPFTLALYEATLETLLNRGIVEVLPGAALKAEVLRGTEFGLKSVGEGCLRAASGFAATEVRVLPSAVIDPGRIERGLSLYFEGAACRVGEARFLLPVSQEDALELGMGFLESDAQWARSMGFHAAARLANAKMDNGETLRARLRSAADMGDDVLVVYDGSESLGYPRAMDKVEEAFRESPSLRLGQVELIEQKGIQTQSAALKDRLIPTHSIGVAELQNMTPDALTTRFYRAVQDRGIQAVYFRLFSAPQGADMEERLAVNLGLLDDFLGRLQGGGFSMGLSQPMPLFQPNPLLRWATLAGVAALLGLGASFFFRESLFPWGGVGAAALFFAAGASGIAPPGAALKALALLDVSLTPALAAGLLLKCRSGAAARAGTAATALLAVLCAGILVAAMLSDSDRFLRIQPFSGVKIAFLAPLALTVLFWGQWGCEGGLAGFFRRPLLLGEVALGAVLLGAAAVYILRSDNTGPLAVPGWERAARDWLEVLLDARPRTKEFLIGYPCLALLAMLGGRLRGRWSGLVLCLGAVVGFVSVANTFCHFHTPIAFSLLRFANGLILGLLTSAVFTVAVAVGLKAAPKSLKALLNDLDRMSS